MSKNEQTKYSFEEKWKSSGGYQIGGVESFDTDTLNWIITHNGFKNLKNFLIFLKQFLVILDAVCGCPGRRLSVHLL